MNRRSKILTATIILGGAQLFMHTGKSAEGANPWPADRSPGLTSLAAAADQGRYAFVLFWKEKENDDATQRMQGVVQSGAATLPAPASTVSVQTSDPRERATVEAFGVDRAPLPLVVAVAPNGAITAA